MFSAIRFKIEKRQGKRIVAQITGILDIQEYVGEEPDIKTMLEQFEMLHSKGNEADIKVHVVLLQ